MGIELGMGIDGANETPIGQSRILVGLGVPFPLAIAIYANTLLVDDGPDGSRLMVLLAGDAAQDVPIVAEPIAVFDPSGGLATASEQQAAVSA